MRFLLELLVIGALIYFGWEKPFREQLPSAVKGAVKSIAAQPTPTPTPTPAPELRPIVRATPTPGGWMWDPRHRSPLDPPTTPKPHP